VHQKSEPDLEATTDRARHTGPSLQLRLVAGLGFLAAIGVGALLFSRQLAITGAQEYLRLHYNTEAEVPVRSVRAEFLDDTTLEGKTPPLGFCWTIELDAGPSRAEVTINPWTREVIDWHAEL
jgi:hypothetical protein